MISNIEFWRRNNKDNAMIGPYVTWTENNKTYLSNGMLIWDFTPTWQSRLKLIEAPRGENRRLLMSNLNAYYRDREFAKCVMNILKKGTKS